MEAGNKVTTDTGVVLEAKLQTPDFECAGCYFYNEGTCMMAAVGVKAPCWDEAGKGLIFVKSEDHETMSKSLTIYHGSPKIINDVGFKSGSYFTDDIEVAKSYGNHIYILEVDNKHIQAFHRDIFGEHYISQGTIPIECFKLQIID